MEVAIKHDNILFHVWGHRSLDSSILPDLRWEVHHENCARTQKLVKQSQIIII